jgi:thiamine kinase-like enzyme
VNTAVKSEAAEWGTLLHGDVKGANIFFTPHSTGRMISQADANGPLRCALYDFQYVGIGLCTRDLVCFLGKTAEEKLLREWEDEMELLRFYHEALETALQQRDGATPQYPFDKILRHWEMAIVDWYRFLVTWGMSGNGTWVEKRAREIVQNWERANTIL